jgi:hypothetical protein
MGPNRHGRSRPAGCGVRDCKRGVVVLFAMSTGKEAECSEVTPGGAGESVVRAAWEKAFRPTGTKSQQ